MTGWRIGWIAGNAEIVERYRQLKTNLDSGLLRRAPARRHRGATEARRSRSRCRRSTAAGANSWWTRSQRAESPWRRPRPLRTSGCACRGPRFGQLHRLVLEQSAVSSPRGDRSGPRARAPSESPSRFRTIGSRKRRAESRLRSRSNPGHNRAVTHHQPDPAPGAEPERGFVVAVLGPGVDESEELGELRELLRTAGVAPVGELVQRRQRPDPRTYVGRASSRS